MSAYTYHILGAIQKAMESLDNVKAVDPQLSEQSALYHLVGGSIEPDVDRTILLVRRAVEIAPESQIAHYLLAYYSEMKLRIQDEIMDHKRVKSVINEYDKFLASTLRILYTLLILLYDISTGITQDILTSRHV